jgi:hypothetical protein
MLRRDWPREEPEMNKRIILAAVAATVLATASRAQAFCGFYVGKAGSKLFNKASQVVLVRNGDRTVMTMASDFKGDLKEFAIVIPVPTFLEKDQIHVGEKALVEHVDAYSAPRLVEYYDGNPCLMSRREMMMPMAAQAAATEKDRRASSLGVSIEAQYTVGEYDITILSARQSAGLEAWLRENGYRIPDGASNVIATYLKQNMRFFVAKVNLAEQAKLGFSYLRPLQVAYESPKFMLPIRLGMVNANGAQELFVYALTKNGRVETTNYRTARLPTDVELPLYLKDKGEFGKFYTAMFARQVEKENGRSVFMEYAWDMRWCDPCAANPLTSDELRQLGVFWSANADNSPAPDVFVTRLHVRYDNAHFPEDLVFQETADRSNFQARYILRHPWTGPDSCGTASAYHAQLRERRVEEATRLASLTGWNVADIRKRAGTPDQPSGPEPAWWERLWKK